MITFKKMRKMVSRHGFSLNKSNVKPYNFVLRNNRTRAERHYHELVDIGPDAEEITEGMIPFA